MPQVHWRWVVVGIAFIYGAQLLLAGFARILGPAVETLQGHQALFPGAARTVLVRPARAGVRAAGHTRGPRRAGLLTALVMGAGGTYVYWRLAKLS